MTKYSFIRLVSDSPDPARPGDVYGVVSFAAPAYDIVRDEGCVTVTHVESGNSVDLPLTALRFGVRAPVVAETPKAPAKRGSK